MRRIAVVTDEQSSHLGSALARDLDEVLQGHVESFECFLDSLSPGEQIQADVVLVMTPRKALEVRSRVRETRRILVAQRTIRESEVYRILSLPAGSSVLVVNNHPETTMEMVTLLQQLEFEHVRFVPYEEGMECGDFRIAITPGEGARVPAGVETIIDIGHRCIDVSTFLELISRLRIADPEVERRLHRYSKATVNLDTGVNRQHKELAQKNTELNAVINLAHDGILLLNPSGRIVFCNPALTKMLGLEEECTGRFVEEVFEPELRAALGQGGEERIVEYRGRSIVINRQEVISFGESIGACFNFQEVTYIRSLEQNLSEKLRAKGMIARYTFKDVLTRSPTMLRCIELAKRIATSEFTVLIFGESGTGKELLAQSIHNASARAKQPFVAVNCAAVPEALLESELFGYEGGSFTGALREGKPGLFEQAHHGTIFLDEIGDMPPMLQAKLLRVLQERQVMRVGSQRVYGVDIRVIAATNRDLRERIRAGLFREDLYYRLNALSLDVPPLRSRPEDIFHLLEHFLEGQRPRGLAFSPEAREFLQRYEWPGNIRELSNVANHISMMGLPTVAPETLPSYLTREEESFETEAELLRGRCGLERALEIARALAGAGRNKQGAGRNVLRKLVERQGVLLTDAEVRSSLRLLGKLGLVRSHVGRGGSELTPKGERFVDWSARRSS